jgi:hypothetical protein
MIPAIAAPIALLLHIYSVRNFLLQRNASKGAGNTYIFAAKEEIA